MSYGHGDIQELDSLTAVEVAPVSSNASRYSKADYTRIAHLVKTNIRKIGVITKEIQRITQQIGTLNDTQISRDNLHKKNQEATTLAKSTANHLKTLQEQVNSAPESEKQQKKIQNDRLTSDFKSMLEAFQSAEKEAVEKERQHVAKVRSASSGRYDEGPETFLGTSDKAQLQQQAGISSHELQELEERQEALRQLESDIMDVNQIFKDLASMVESQGEVIDSIENNIERAEVKVEKGKTELGSAAEKQKSARKKKIICVVIVIVVLAIIGLAIGLSV